ncbi:MAG: hypothetical protein PHD73_00310 [Sediminibacterium sp.]|nr:hypothetical protein [Sediminibacterium sp.]
MFTATNGTAQTTAVPQKLFQFSATELSPGLFHISWKNPYKKTIQLAVQRSADSIRNFRTILSAQNPALEINGFTDHTAPHDIPVFYRIFLTLEGGNYFFTPVLRAQKAIAQPEVSKPVLAELPNAVSETKGKTTVVKKAALSIPKPAATEIKKDSIVPPKIVVPANPFLNKKPSRYVYTDAKGYLNISLPKVAMNQYKLIIYDTDGSRLFTIEHIREPELIVEKVNFLHSGWFNFELFENGLLMEQNRFYIQ